MQEHFTWSRQYNLNYSKLKKATPWFQHVEKARLEFSSSAFVIPVNLLHPWPSLFVYGLLFSLWCFSILVNYHFQVSFNWRVIFRGAKATQNIMTDLLWTAPSEMKPLVRQSEVMNRVQRNMSPSQFTPGCEKASVASSLGARDIWISSIAKPGLKSVLNSSSRHILIRSDAIYKIRTNQQIVTLLLSQPCTRKRDYKHLSLLQAIGELMTFSRH